jgi:hypothetical protein
MSNDKGLPIGSPCLQRTLLPLYQLPQARLM